MTAEQADLDFLRARFSRMLDVYGEGVATAIVVEALTTAIAQQPPRDTTPPRVRLDSVRQQDTLKKSEFRDKIYAMRTKSVTTKERQKV